MLGPTHVDVEKVFDLQGSRHFSDRAIDNAPGFLPLIVDHIVNALVQGTLHVFESCISCLFIFEHFSLKLDVLRKVDLLEV